MGQAKKLDMILKEKDALDRVCVPLCEKSHGHKRLECIGSECLAYWRWMDAGHEFGYCSIIGKPEFK